MKYNLYTIKQKGFFTKHYKIYKEDLQVYYAKSRFFLSGLTLYDMDDFLVLKVKKEIAFFKMKMRITKDQQDIAIVTKKLFSNSFEIETNHGKLYVNGNLFAKSFTIVKDDKEIAKISRKINFLMINMELLFKKIMIAH